MRARGPQGPDLLRSLCPGVKNFLIGMQCWGGGRGGPWPPPPKVSKVLTPLASFQCQSLQVAPRSFFLSIVMHHKSDWVLDNKAKCIAHFQRSIATIVGMLEQSQKCVFRFS